MTLSIVGRDPRSGEVGVATQSQALAVGNSVPFARVATGVIATQSLTEPMYGQLGLDLLGSGLTAEEVLQALQAVDPHPQRRQVAVVPVEGPVAAYTGAECVAEAGHCVGADCAAVANLAATGDVWVAMRDTFESSAGTLTERLLAALHAGEAEGGDVRGKRSAALVVVRSRSTGRPWHDTVVDLRIDDELEPVTELTRLVRTRFRYQEAVEAFEQALDGGAADADRTLTRLHEDEPLDGPDHVLRRAVVAGLVGDEDRGRELIGQLREQAPQFIEVARRYAAAGTIPTDLVQRLLGADA